MSQPDNLSILTKVNEQKLVRWFDLQLDVLRAGQTQKISMTRYEVEFSIHLLQKLLKTLSRLVRQTYMPRYCRQYKHF